MNTNANRTETGNTETVARNKRTLFGVCVNCYRNLMRQIEKVKGALRAEFSETTGRNHHLFQLALTEAEALAWQTEYPELVFPALAREKAESLTVWQRRQQALRRQAARVLAR